MTVMALAQKTTYTQQHPGYTLIELMIVLLLVGILALTGLPTLARSLDERKVTWMARQIMSDLHYLQAFAVKDGNPYALAFNTSDDWYQAIRVTVIIGTDLGGQTIEHPITGKMWLVSFAEGSDFGGLELAEADFGGKEWVAFDASGAPDAAGYVRIACGEFERRIEVSRSTRVTPISMLKPSWSLAVAIRSPPTDVPLRLLRSVIQKLPSSSLISQCKRETSVSISWRSLRGSRPMTIF